VNALEFAGRQGMILDRDGQPPDPRIERRSLGLRPRAQHVARLQPKIEVQRGGVVQLHNEARRFSHAPQYVPEDDAVRRSSGLRCFSQPAGYGPFAASRILPGPNVPVSGSMCRRTCSYWVDAPSTRSGSVAERHIGRRRLSIPTPWPRSSRPSRPEMFTSASSS